MGLHLTKVSEAVYERFQDDADHEFIYETTRTLAIGDQVVLYLDKQNPTDEESVGIECVILGLDAVEVIIGAQPTSKTPQKHYLTLRRINKSS